MDGEWNINCLLLSVRSHHQSQAVSFPPLADQPQVAPPPPPPLHQGRVRCQ